MRECQGDSVWIGFGVCDIASLLSEDVCMHQPTFMFVFTYFLCCVSTFAYLCVFCAYFGAYLCVFCAYFVCIFVYLMCIFCVFVCILCAFVCIWCVFVCI